MEKNKGIIIAGFGAIGKTTLGNKYDSVIDLESGYFQWDNTGFENIPYEQRKGKGVIRKSNPNWPINYFHAIEEATHQYDIVLTSMHLELLNYFEVHKIPFYLAYPSQDSAEVLVKRCYERGNNALFSEKLRKNIIDWEDRKKNSMILKILIIPKDVYLEDVLINEGLLRKPEEHLCSIQ